MIDGYKTGKIKSSTIECLSLESQWLFGLLIGKLCSSMYWVSLPFIASMSVSSPSMIM